MLSSGFPDVTNCDRDFRLHSKALEKCKGPKTLAGELVLMRQAHHGLDHLARLRIVDGIVDAREGIEGKQIVGCAALCWNRRLYVSGDRRRRKVGDGLRRQGRKTGHDSDEVVGFVEDIDMARVAALGHSDEEPDVPERHQRDL